MTLVNSEKILSQRLKRFLDTQRYGRRSRIREANIVSAESFYFIFSLGEPATQKALREK